MYLAKKRPSSLQQIKNRRINRKFLSKYGNDLIKIIEKAVRSDETYELPTEDEKLLASTLQCWAKLVAEEIGIHSALLMPTGTAKTSPHLHPKEDYKGGEAK